MPTTFWIARQLPAELTPLFGFREETIPERYRDEIQYLYQVEYPDGTPYRVPLLVEYIDDQDAPAVAFVVGDRIELDGIPVTVEDWDSRPIPATTSLPEYTHHQVLVRLPGGEVDGG